MSTEKKLDPVVVEVAVDIIRHIEALTSPLSEAQRLLAVRSAFVVLEAALENLPPGKKQ